MEKQKKVPKRVARTGTFKQLNDGPKLPRSVRVAPGTGARNKNKVANLDELDMLHHAAISQINECNQTNQLPTGNAVYMYKLYCNMYLLSNLIYNNSAQLA